MPSVTKLFLKANKTYLYIVLLSLLTTSFATGTKQNALSNITQLQHQGDAQLIEHHYDKAAKIYNSIIEQYPYETLTKVTRLHLIYADYRNRSYDKSYLDSTTFLHLFPQDPHADYALFFKALSSYQNKSSWLQTQFKIDPATHDLSGLKQSYQDFRTLTETFPNSHYYYFAYNKMRQIRDLLTKKEFMIARFYQQKHAYVAANNRCIAVLKNYPGSPYLAHCLTLLKENYAALNIPAKHAIQSIKIKPCTRG